MRRVVVVIGVTHDLCSHSRLVEDEYTDDNERKGNFICRECGAVVLHDLSFHEQ